jgi:hypothetical protein
MALVRHCQPVLLRIDATAFVFRPTGSSRALAGSYTEHGAGTHHSPERFRGGRGNIVTTVAVPDAFTASREPRKMDDPDADGSIRGP